LSTAIEVLILIALPELADMIEQFQVSGITVENQRV